MAKAYVPPIRPRDFDRPRPPLGEVYVKRLELGWGDCDPAQIAYTGRLPELALRAIEGWSVAVLGGNWFELNLDWGLDSPFVRLGLEFLSPVTPRASLDCEVYVTRLGNSSLAQLVVARQAGRLSFTCRSVQVYVDRLSFVPAPLLANVRETIEAYRDAFPPPPEFADDDA